LVNDNSHSSKEIIDNIKVDILTKTIFVYSPQGDIVELPKGSTVLDYAYYIHSDIGNHAISATINGDSVVSIFYKLEIGQVVKVVTSKVSKPEME